MKGGRILPPFLTKIVIDFAAVFKVIRSNHQKYEILYNFPPRVPGYGIQISFQLI